MEIHRPKTITSAEGLGVNTHKHMRRVSDTFSLGTETWLNVVEPWQESGVVIADTGYIWITQWQVGAQHVITEICDKTGKCKGTYVDICQPVTADDDGFSFVDLYLDVWCPAGGQPKLLDEDELAAAVAAGYVKTADAEAAHEVAEELMQRLAKDHAALLY